MSHNLESELSDLLGTMDWVAIYLTEHSGPDSDGISIRQFFLALRDDEPMLMEFSAKLADQIIAYCLPRKRLAKEMLINGPTADVSGEMTSNFPDNESNRRSFRCSWLVNEPPCSHFSRA